MLNYPQIINIQHYFTKGQPLAFGKRDVILGNLPVPDGVYYLASGYVKSYGISDDGEEHTQFIFGPRELFPLAWAYLGSHPRALFYEAISDCVVWRVNRDHFTQFIHSSVEAGYAMAQQLAQQHQYVYDRLENLEYKKASERVAYRLLFLANRFGTRHNGWLEIAAPVTHDLLANSINLSRESVSREFEKLERLFIVRRSNHHILILDPTRLARRMSEPANLYNWRFPEPEKEKEGNGV